MRNIIDYFFSNLKVLSGLKQFNLNIARKKKYVVHIEMATTCN